MVVTVFCVWLGYYIPMRRMTESLLLQHTEFAQAMDDYRYADAYQFMSPEFRNDCTVADFEMLQQEPGMIYPFSAAVDIRASPFSRIGYVGYDWLSLDYYTRYEWEFVDGRWYYTGKSKRSSD